MSLNVFTIFYSCIVLLVKKKKILSNNLQDTPFGMVANVNIYGALIESLVISSEVKWQTGR